MKIIAACFLLLLLIGCVNDKEEPWNLVWSDEFDIPGLPDTANWNYEVGYIANNELQYYTPGRLENCVVSNGNLLIIGREEPWNWAKYTSARLNTDGKHSWTYGKFDASIRLPEGQGMWPAFWMLGQNIHTEGWPECGEIDIMEHINNEDILYGTLHWHNDKHVMNGDKTPCDVTKYHNYSVEWDRDSIKWFLDGKKYHQVAISDSANSTSEFHKPFYIIFNLAIGGDWPKNPDETTQFPDTMFVDYVRVYQK
jgi:beta-glucanase (GH16 family)